MGHNYDGPEVSPRGPLVLPGLLGLLHGGRLGHGAAGLAALTPEEGRRHHGIEYNTHIESDKHARRLADGLRDSTRRIRLGAARAQEHNPDV